MRSAARKATEADTSSGLPTPASARPRHHGYLSFWPCGQKVPHVLQCQFCHVGADGVPQEPCERVREFVRLELTEESVDVVGVLVVRPWASETLRDLVHLRDNQRRGTSHLQGDLTRVIGRKRAHGHEVIVDERCLEADCPTSCPVPVGWNPCAAPTSASGQRFGNHEVDKDPVRRDPRARLIGRHEPRRLHGVVDQRVVVKEPRIENDIAVLRRLSQRHAERPCVQVDRLSPDDDDRFALGSQRLRGVEQRRPRTDQEIRGLAIHLRSSPTTS